MSLHTLVLDLLF